MCLSAPPPKKQKKDALKGLFCFQKKYFHLFNKFEVGEVNHYSIHDLKEIGRMTGYFMSGIKGLQKKFYIRKKTGFPVPTAH